MLKTFKLFLETIALIHRYLSASNPLFSNLSKTFNKSFSSSEKDMAKLRQNKWKFCFG